MADNTITLGPKVADDTLQYEVDKNVLELLISDVVKMILTRTAKSITNEEQILLHLNMIDSFIAAFKDMHLNVSHDPELQFRLQLLRFTVLFSQRRNSSNLKKWRAQLQSARKARRRHAKRSNEKLHIPELRPQSKSAPTEKSDDQDNALGNPPDTKSSPAHEKTQISLLDILPSFMSLSAAGNALHDEARITPMWMVLAVGFMAQAVIEHFLDLRLRQSHVLEEAFAWGLDADAQFEEGSDEYLVNAMFFDDTGEFPEWTEFRRDHIDALVPPEGKDLLEHLKALRQSVFPLQDFEDRMLAFIQGLAQSLPEPALSQIDWRRLQT